MTDPHETARKLVEAGILKLPPHAAFVHAWEHDDATRSAEGVLWKATPPGGLGAQWLPDLDDPTGATQGVLLKMLMERTREVVAYPQSLRPNDEDQRHALIETSSLQGGQWRDSNAPTLGEALALALLEMKETTDG